MDEGVSRRRFLQSVAVGNAAAVVGCMGDDGNTTTSDDGSGRDGPDPERERVEWTFETGGEVESTPTVADGTVYITSEDRRLYALDAASGAAQWTFETRAPSRPVNGTRTGPAVGDGAVYFQTLPGDGNVYAVDADTGAQLWQAGVGGSTSVPVLADGRLYFGSLDGNVYALAPDTGEELWRYESSGIVSGTPRVVDGTVYVAIRDDHLYALDAETGEAVWRVDVGATPTARPAVADGTVYMANGDVYAVDADTGDQQWRFGGGSGDEFHASPVVADGTVYASGPEEARLTALDADSGERVWDGLFAQSPPAVVGDTLFVVAKASVRALDPSDGSERWSVETPIESDGYAVNRGGPAVVGDTLYAGSVNGTVYAISID